MRVLLRGVRLAILLFLMASAVSAAPSSADSKRAAESFESGKGAYARGEFSAAAASFEQAAMYSPHPATFLNAAEAWELAGNPVKAAQICDKVLDTPSLDPRFQKAAAKQLARVVNKVGTLDVKAKSSVVIDGERHEPGKVRVTPGAHTVDGESVSVQGGETKEVDHTALKAEPNNIKKDRPSSSGPPTVTWIMFGAAVVAGGVGTWFGIRTLDAKDTFDASPTIETRDAFNQARLGTNISLGLAGVAVIVGALMWLASPSKDAH